MDKLGTYTQALKAYNEHTNIYAATAYDALPWHIEGSVGLAQWVGDEGPVIDFGSGCGLPAIPLAIALPHRQVVAIESKGRKTVFLKQVAHTLGLGNLTVVTQDIAAWATQNPVMGTVTAKAFKPLPVLMGYLHRHRIVPQRLLIPASLASWEGWQSQLATVRGYGFEFIQWDTHGVIVVTKQGG